MNGVWLGFLTVYGLFGSVATIAAALFAVQRGLKGAGWPDRERWKAIGSIAALLVVWFFAALVPGRIGFYHQPGDGVPKIVYGLFVPMVLLLALFRAWPFLRRVVDAVPQQWLAGVQFYRVLGVIFLVLYAAGKLPGVFALPAGLGDVATGLAAPLVGIAFMRSPRGQAGRLRAWNWFGIADLVVAVATGFLTSPSRFQLLSLDKPNELITAFPLVLIPVFLVPLAILLHLASLWKLRWAAEPRGTRTVVTLPVG